MMAALGDVHVGNQGTVTPYKCARTPDATTIYLIKRLGRWENFEISNNMSQQFPPRACEVQLFPSFHLSTLPATAPPSHLNVFLRVFTCHLVPKVCLMCFQAFYMCFTPFFLVVFSLFGRFFGFLRGMSCFSSSFGLIHICYSLFALFPIWVGLIPVPWQLLVLGLHPNNSVFCAFVAQGEAQ